MVGLESGCKFAEKPLLELTKEPLSSMLVCQEQNPRKSLGICQLYIASSPFSSFTTLRVCLDHKRKERRESERKESIKE